MKEVKFELGEVVDPLLIINRKQKITGGNGALLRLFGYGADFFDGTHDLDELLPKSCKDRHRNQVESVFVTPRVSIMGNLAKNVRGKTARGKIIPLIVTFYPYKYNESGVLEKYCAIITKRVERPEKWKNPASWIPLLLSCVGVVGWFLQIPGAMDLLIATAGLRVGASIVNQQQKMKGG